MGSGHPFFHPGEFLQLINHSNITVTTTISIIPCSIVVCIALSILSKYRNTSLHELSQAMSPVSLQSLLYIALADARLIDMPQVREAEHQREVD